MCINLTGSVYFQLKKEGAFQIFADDYVTDDSGTGVVHSAPAFGEVSKT